jgi:hypothetical protein
MSLPSAIRAAQYRRRTSRLSSQRSARLPCITPATCLAVLCTRAPDVGLLLTQLRWATTGLRLPLECRSCSGRCRQQSRSGRCNRRCRQWSPFGGSPSLCSFRAHRATRRCRSRVSKSTRLFCPTSAARCATLASNRSKLSRKIRRAVRLPPLACDAAVLQMRCAKTTRGSAALGFVFALLCFALLCSRGRTIHSGTACECGRNGGGPSSAKRTRSDWRERRPKQRSTCRCGLAARSANARGHGSISGRFTASRHGSARRATDNSERNGSAFVGLPLPQPHGHTARRSAARHGTARVAGSIGIRGLVTHSVESRLSAALSAGPVGGVAGGSIGCSKRHTASRTGGKARRAVVHVHACAIARAHLHTLAAQECSERVVYVAAARLCGPVVPNTRAHA